MSCEEANRRYMDKYLDGHPPEKHRGEMAICVGCGLLMRSVPHADGWQWRHGQKAPPACQ